MTRIPDPYDVPSLSRPCRATVRVPGSKSITNRALIIAALADGTSTLENFLLSDDSRYCAAALEQLGFAITIDETSAVATVMGHGGRIPSPGTTLFLGNSGTALRFLTALVALGHGSYILDGTERMRERPIGDLLIALRDLGVAAHSVHATECPPVMVATNGVRGGCTRVAADKSSQFLSGLLMAAPAMADGLRVEVTAATRERLTLPYVEITRAVMRDFGVDSEYDATTHAYIVAPQPYRSRQYVIEPDASGASYFFAAAAVTGGSVRVLGLGTGSVQGDMRFLDVLQTMGCSITQTSEWTEVQGPTQLRGIDIDMNAFSDTALTLAAIAPFASAPVRVSHIGHTRLQECDRIAAAVNELRRLGARAEEEEDGFIVYPSSKSLHAAAVETYNDHRVAMSFALTGLRIPGLRISNPGCVSKTFPTFFECLTDLHQQTEETD